MNPPQKEVIYVDTEDDITSVIHKVKSAKASIVALVPPKRIGMLQSAVNLKLIQRTAETVNKRLVLITSDTALTALAAGVAIPVAKNLQSKPEVAPITALNVDDEEVIDGESLPGPKPDSDIGIGSAMPVATSAVASGSSDKTSSKGVKKKDSNASKIPDFDKFKKRVLLIGGGVLAFVIFFVWAIWFAPQATVTIAAKMTPYNVSQEAVARPGADLDTEESTLPAEVVSKKQTKTVEFTATGRKEVGKKATGSVSLSHQSISDRTVPAGTELSSSSGRVYVTDSAATIPASRFGPPDCFPTACPGETSVSVTAKERGSAGNGASGDLSGAPRGVDATFEDSTSGGTDKTVTVVSDADVVKAREELAGVDEEALRDELMKEFEGKDVIVVEESFRVDTGDPVASPAVGEEASNASIKSEITYQIIGLDKSDLEKIIDKNVVEQLEGLPDQRIYQHGVDETRISQLNIEDGNYRFVIEATAYVGPHIDEKDLATQLVDKVEGEIQEVVKSRDGVQNVEVDFSPFWVNRVNSEDKITIKFDLENAN